MNRKWICTLLLALCLLLTLPAGAEEHVLILPRRTVAVEEEAFMGDTGIAKVVLPEGVKSIGARAFSGCAGLKEISLPGSVTQIGEDAFEGCADGLTLMVERDSFAHLYARQRAFPFLCTDALSAQEGLISGEYTYSILTDGTVRIDKWAGEAAQLTIPQKLEGRRVSLIGESAFQGLNALQSVTLPAGIHAVEDGAFAQCGALTRIALPDGLTYLGASAFAGCEGLQSIAIPKGVTRILPWTFHDCRALQTVTLPKGLKAMEGHAFHGCEGLQAIALPQELETIGAYAFRGCVALTLTVTEDSYAHEYALDNGIPYELAQ